MFFLGAFRLQLRQSHLFHRQRFLGGSLFFRKLLILLFQRRGGLLDDNWLVRPCAQVVGTRRHSDQQAGRNGQSRKFSALSLRRAILRNRRQRSRCFLRPNLLLATDACPQTFSRSGIVPENPLRSSQIPLGKRGNSFCSQYPVLRERLLARLAMFQVSPQFGQFQRRNAARGRQSA